jgi:hypothetical protein
MKTIFDFQKKHYDRIYSLATGKTYFECRYCGKITKTEDAMYKHIINYHFKGNIDKAWDENAKPINVSKRKSI